MSSDFSESFGSDSFLDVVCNMVGILIILVIIVGLRVQHSPAPSDSAAASAAATALAKSAAECRGLDDDVAEIARQIQSVELEAVVRGRERALLARLAAEARHELSGRKTALSSSQQAALEAHQQREAARQRLAELRQLNKHPRDLERPKIEVVSYPTPLGKTVFGHEAHFQLREHRLAFIPLDALVERMRRDFERNVNKLRDQSEVTDSVGPIDGFRMRYTFERVDASFERQMATGQFESYARLVEWTLIPVAAETGETLERALQPDSRFAGDLGGLDPKNATITIWVYPESFADFRKLKERLHGLGFATAGRPLPDGMPIAGSPQGSRSSAE